MYAKYFNIYTNKSIISNLSTFYIINSLAKNTIVEKNLTTIKDNNSYFSNYYNNLDNENKNQNILLNDH